MENETALGGLFEEPEVELEGEDDEFDPDGNNRVSLTGEEAKRERQKAILDMLNNMSSTDRLDFTNGLVTFVGKRNDRGVIDALMPGLQKLSVDNGEIKKALLNQLKPLIELFTNKFGDDGYKSVTETAFPILDKLLYDNDE